jgi:hypothetical protein
VNLMKLKPQGPAFARVHSKAPEKALNKYSPSCLILYSILFYFIFQKGPQDLYNLQAPENTDPPLTNPINNEVNITYATFNIHIILGLVIAINEIQCNPLRTKMYPSDLKTQFVLRSKYYLPRL